MKTYIMVNNNGDIVGISEDAKIEAENCLTYELDEKIDFSKIGGLVFKDGQVSFDNEKFETRLLEEKKRVLRNKRKEVCFSVVDRNYLWYDEYVNTEERKTELANWYRAWLNVTETMIEPEIPEWIK